MQTNKNPNFIKVSDKDTVEKLMKLGFQLVDTSNNIHTFLNTDKIQFSKEIDINKIRYSNVLCI